MCIKISVEAYYDGLYNLFFFLQISSEGVRDMRSEQQ